MAFSVLVAKPSNWANSSPLAAAQVRQLGDYAYRPRPFRGDDFNFGLKVAEFRRVQLAQVPTVSSCHGQNVYRDTRMCLPVDAGLLSISLFLHLYARNEAKIRRRTGHLTEGSTIPGGRKRRHCSTSGGTRQLPA